MTKQEAKKYEFDEKVALAKISVLISKFYERIGREGREDIEMDAEREELIEEIEGVLQKTELSAKHLVIERLEADNEIKDSLKGRWKADGTFK